MTFKRLFVFSVTPLAAAALLSACGGDSEDDGGGSGGGKKYTLETVCDQIVPELCNIRKDCCTAGVGYDQAECEKREREECDADVAEVEKGTMTFRPELIDGCLTKFRSLLSDCDANLLDLVGQLADFQECFGIFEGELAEGATCARDSQCKQPGGGMQAECDDDTKTCMTNNFAFAGNGEPCDFEDGPDQAFCGAGLYCDANVAMGMTSGTCKTATALGATCDTLSMFQLECGLGNFCDPSTGVCSTGAKSGEPCTGGLECQSLQCNEMTGVCEGGGFTDAGDCGV